MPYKWQLEMAVRSLFPFLSLSSAYHTEHTVLIWRLLPCFVFAFFIEVPVKASSLLSGACQEEVMSTVLVFL